MQYSEIIYLIQRTLSEDEIGNVSSSTEVSKKCYAKKQSVKTNEFYNAIENGLNPSMELVIKRLNYSGEDEVEWNGKRFKVIRTIDPKNKFDIVLVCAEKIGITAKVIPSA